MQAKSYVSYTDVAQNAYYRTAFARRALISNASSGLVQIACHNVPFLASPCGGVSGCPNFVPKADKQRPRTAFAWLAFTLSASVGNARPMILGRPAVSSGIFPFRDLFSGTSVVIGISTFCLSRVTLRRRGKTYSSPSCETSVLGPISQTNAPKKVQLPPVQSAEAGTIGIKPKCLANWMNRK
ncbi:hypothetical protein C8R47DRAFT_1145457 [Mycena vitilis]|nr:hypothetical protein C8R47DRAFT_1145457 [Mycena vitilis]